MKYDSYSRFLKSQMYKDCLKDVDNEMKTEEVFLKDSKSYNLNHQRNKLNTSPGTNFIYKENYNIVNTRFLKKV
jgi:hypothetical protein